ncbi:MATE family efflux transporter [Blautia caecimuris]|uniref:MATE family efflux transporter n=1 Tax=Blautia caecimuris TaxID=1796615 RepID=UPI0034AE6D8C
MNKNIDFVNGNTKKCLIEMSVPMIIAMFLNMAYNLVDSLWIGNLLGEQAYAALTNSTPIILILTSIGMGATNGLAILLSQVIGAKNEQKKKNIIATSFFVSVILSVLITIVLEIFLEPILIVLNTPTEIFDMAKNYLSIYVLGYVAVYLYLYFTAVLRSFGNTMFQAVAMLVSTLLNAILDPIFINIIGFHGAAIATLISQIICLVFMCIYIYRKKLFNLSLSDFDTTEIMPFINNAVPSVIQQSIPAISTTFLTAIVSTYSISAIAGYGVAGKLEMILFYPAMALNMVLTSIVGQCIGAQRIDRAKNYLKLALKYGIIVSIVLSAVVIFFSKQLAKLFVSNEAVTNVVSHYFLIVSIGYILYTITSCYLGTLNGMGKPTKSMVLYNGIVI